MKKILDFIIFIITIVSCKPETQYRYYPSGEICEKKEYFNKKDTSSYILTQYYPNQQKKMQGDVINNNKEGIWNEWYSDGDLLWIGKYFNNHRQPPNTIGYPIYLFSDSLIVGTPVYLRVSLPEVHREDLGFGCTGSISVVQHHLDLYDLIVIPEKQGYMKFYLWALKINPHERIQMVDSFYVYPNCVSE